MSVGGVQKRGRSECMLEKSRSDAHNCVFPQEFSAFACANAHV